MSLPRILLPKRLLPYCKIIKKRPDHENFVNPLDSLLFSMRTLATKEDATRNLILIREQLALLLGQVIP